MELHDDDKPVGRVLSRREIIKLLGGSGAALFVGMSLPKIVKAQDVVATPLTDALPTCVVQPEVTEGPYFVGEQLNRMDIRVEPGDNSIKDGMSFYLIFRISDVTNGICSALKDAQVDIWHCDSDGVYSGVEDPGFDTEGEKWLRGYQITDENGLAEFLTIVPGWYSGRAVHIHFKIRTIGTDGESYEFTSQLFFDADLLEQIYSQEPYVDKGLPDTSNEVDNIYQQTDGQLDLTLYEMDASDIATLQEKVETVNFTAGYKALIDIGLDLSDTQVAASDSAGGGGMGMPPQDGSRPGGRGTPPSNP